jgi:hypothetical protein
MSKSRPRFSLSHAAFALLATIGSGCGSAPELETSGRAVGLQILSVDETFDGKSYSELSAAWWQWAFSMPLGQHPLVPEAKTGCEAGQQGSVWFLGGSFSQLATGEIRRECGVPRGKALYVPMLNAVAYDYPAGSYTEAQLRDRVSQTLERGMDVFAELDGVPVKASQLPPQDSGPFAITVPQGGIFKTPAGVHERGVDTGYYLLIHPPTQGRHTLTLHARVPRMDVSYFLTVE